MEGGIESLSDMNSKLGSANYETVNVVPRKRRLTGREFKKLLARAKRVKAIDQAHGKQDRLSESGCSVNGTNGPNVTSMRVAESSCSNSTEERLDDSLQEQTSTCNVQDERNTKSLLDLKLTNPEACDPQCIDSKQVNEIEDELKKCLICSNGGKLLCCAGKGCGRKFHLPCVDPPLTYFPLGAWYCIWCVKKKMELGVHAVSEGVESILDSRGVDCENEVMHKKKQIQKEYLVKYKGLAHIHNRWIPKTELILEASTLLARFNKYNKNVSWKTDWTMPHSFLEKRLLLLPESSETDSLGHNDNDSNCRYEWLVKWTGLDYDQATWELETAPCLNSPKALKMISDYESHHKMANPEVDPSKKDKDKGSKTPLPELLTFPFEFTAQVHSNYLIYVNKLLKYWRTSENAVVIDSQERILKMVLLISSFATDMRRPFLIISTLPTLSYWEDEFSRCAPSINAVVYKGNEHIRSIIRTLEFYNVQGAIMFQVLISHSNAVVEDIEMLKSINWEAIIIDTSQQSSAVLQNFKHIKVLATDKKLLLFRQVEDRRFSYRKFLSLLDPEYEEANIDFPESGAYTEDIMFKERFNKFIAYECKSSMSKFVEYWVPVMLSDVQIQQYCDCLLSNSSLLCSSLKCSLHDILISTRKCCDHPYLVDSTLWKSMVEDIPVDKQLDVEIELGGKLQLLNMILFEIRKRGLRVLILYQSFPATGAIQICIGDILDDVINHKFGIESYARISGNVVAQKRRDILNNFNNKESGKFVLLMETRACVPSIKLSGIDSVVVFDSDWDPMNDLRALQKITIDSKFEELKVFRLYSSCTIEENTLILAKSGLAVDSNIKRLKQTTCHELLSWGASYLFNKHDDRHRHSHHKALVDEVFSELLNLLPSTSSTGSAKCLRILKVQQHAGAYPQSITLPGELEMGSVEASSIISGLIDDGHASLFWRNLLQGRKHLSNPSRRVRKKHRRSERDKLRLHKPKDSTIIPDSYQFQADKDGIEATRSTDNEQDQINCGVDSQAPMSFPIQDSNPPPLSSVQQSAGHVSAVQVDVDGMETNGTTPNQQDFGSDNNPIESSGMADVPQSQFLDPLQREMNKIQKEREQTMKLHEDLKLLLISELEKEILEIRKKYDLLLQNVEMEIVQKQNECDARYSRVHLHQLLAEFMIHKRNANYPAANSEEMEKESLASQPVVDAPLNLSTQIMTPPTTNSENENSDHARNHPSAVQHTASLQISSVGLPRSDTMFSNPVFQSVVPQRAGPPEQFVTPTSCYPRPLSCITKTTMNFSGNLQVGCQIRAPAPHLRHLRPTPVILENIPR